MAVLLDGHTWLWVNTYTPQFDVSWSHGGKGSPFDVHCRQYSSEMCWVALLDRFTLASGRTLSNWSCILLSTVGSVEPHLRIIGKIYLQRK